MKINYLAHSSFLVECGKTKILFDPWLNGSAYSDQWFLWPLPPNKSEFLQTDAILISHGHEDHMHAPTLKTLDKNTHLFFPFQWKSGARPYLKSLGYRKVTEAKALKTYTVNDVQITFIGYSLESVIVLEYENEVLVNINDALNSNHENAANFILTEIKQRWPKIDYLFSGWSGASYFPNQVDFPGKNNVEIGKLREQYFAHNFFKFTNALQPTYSACFPPGFVLLKKENQWINHVKFPRNELEAYYTNHFDNTDSTSFLTPMPGDVIQNGRMEKVSQLHGLGDEKFYEMAYGYYEKETLKVNTITWVDETVILQAIDLLTYWLNFNKQLYNSVILNDAQFSIRLDDVQVATFLNIQFKNGRFTVSCSNSAMPEKRLLISTTTNKLIQSLERVWGGDVLTIGYGFKVEIYDQLTLEKNLDIVCLRLITRYPIARKEMPKEPFRVLNFYGSNLKITTFWLKQKMLLKPYVNKYPFNERDHWLTYNKCDLCAVCKMPEINLDAYA